ncbi:MAG TPA: MaoC/PaaZ C-terminal domain-containing protein [Nocardioides sp.]|jgi:acyl dehydratase|uniref:MaoC/PaaZ C-terminal domain-containing protein n=1 Tax=Nocardioides sp. TaxID=35761 RepID=UPI002E313470|nr:MaoC/PaaZ C-terminal domain-containing protein [Nocardioides sp.]HEX3932453.1 MaoC/PaaZ C-terminal domain-containing protein [Nocardioides sp.]
MGTELEPRVFRVTRGDLVAYAEASGDHNPIHQDDEVARSVGLPGVIAHGMYTMALAARYVEEWAGGRGRVATIGAKFTKPVPVPPEGADVEIAGVADDQGDERVVTLTVTCGGEQVLGRFKATLRD